MDLVYQKNEIYVCLWQNVSYLINLSEGYGKHHPVSTDGGGIWYPPQACKFLKLDHHHIINSSYEKSIIERAIQYIKDRTTECFDDYFPCRKRNVN